MSKKVMVIINPNAGEEKAIDYKEQLKKKLSEDYSSVEIRETRGEGDAQNWAEEASKNAFGLVVAVGGDGTVNETINGMAKVEDSPLLGIVPMGQ